MNYVDTFIQVAPDSPVTGGIVPPMRGRQKPVHLIQYELVSKNPYVYTQEDVLWESHVQHKGIPRDEAGPEMRQEFFAKEQPCLRASALAKKYGWGFHFDSDGKVALYAVESEAYRRFAEPTANGPKLLYAMRSKRA